MLGLVFSNARRRFTERKEVTMRIVSGTLSGRIIQDTHGNKTHPMSEKIRGALFNALGDIIGLKILDAFSGTGAVAIEAVSRGASLVQAIDIDKEAGRCIQKNIKDLSLMDKIKFSQANIGTWLDNNQNVEFDVIVADPPHDDIKVNMLQKIANFVKIGGLIVYCLPANLDFKLDDSTFTKLATKDYGDAKLEFYRFIG